MHPRLDSVHRDQRLEGFDVVVPVKQRARQCDVLLHITYQEDQHEIEITCNLIALLNLRAVLKAALHLLKEICPLTLYLDFHDDG